MLIWFAENAATILICAVLAAVVFLILRGMVRGRIKACGDCGSCGGCSVDDAASGCAACPYHGACGGAGDSRS